MVDLTENNKIEIPSGFRKEMEETFGAARAEKLITSLNGTPEVSIRLNPKKLSAEDARGLEPTAFPKIIPISDPRPQSQTDSADDSKGDSADSFKGSSADGFEGGSAYGSKGDSADSFKGDSADGSKGDSVVSWCERGRYLAERPQFAMMPEWHAGGFYVQDASSMFVGFVIRQLNERFQLANIRLLDLCAAPGGKTTAALDELPEDSIVVANELIGSRAAILKENLLKWGRKDVIVTSADSAKFAKVGGVFDIVIADVPCSGEGMMRKDEEARRQWSPGLVAQCTALQREIAGNAVEALRPGGFMIYSTCTFNTSEDEENVRYLIEEYGLEPVEIEVDADWGIGREVTGDAPCYRFLPGEIRGEGLFMSVLRKPETDSLVPRSGKPQKPAKVSPKGWLKEDCALKIYENGGYLYALTDAAAGLLAQLQNAKIGILAAGVQVAEVKGKDFIPQPGLAWSDAMADGAFPEVELDRDSALQYLRREAVIFPEDTPRGFVIAKYNGLRLGFAKNLGNRANNLYPQEYRLRLK